MLQLSITIAELGLANGFILSKRPSMNSANVSVVNEPSTIFTWRIPSKEYGKDRVAGENCE
jgi:hypothetical protein